MENELDGEWEAVRKLSQQSGLNMMRGELEQLQDYDSFANPFSSKCEGWIDGWLVWEEGGKGNGDIKYVLDWGSWTDNRIVICDTYRKKNSLKDQWKLILEILRLTARHADKIWNRKLDVRKDIESRNIDMKTSDVIILSSSESMLVYRKRIAFVIR